MAEEIVDERKSKLKVVEKCLKELGHSYQNFQDSGFVVSDFLNGGKDSAINDKSPHLLIVLDRGLVFLTNLGLTVPRQRVSKVALALHFINDKLPYGDFELTERGSGVAFKISTFFGSDTPTDTAILLKDCIASTTHCVNTFRRTIESVSNGTISPERAAEIASPK